MADQLEKDCVPSFEEIMQMPDLPPNPDELIEREMQRRAEGENGEPSCDPNQDRVPPGLSDGPLIDRREILSALTD